jgi:hypothetical protein
MHLIQQKTPSENIYGSYHLDSMLKQRVKTRKLWMHRLKPLRIWILFTAVFFVFLLISPFILPMGYTYDKVCPECHGSGICWVCGGDGETILGWCAACHGSGDCFKCDGTGLVTHWMYSSLGATFYSSWIFVFSFLGLFFVSYVVLEISLLFNDWVYDVKGMNFLGNPMFMTWLYATDRRRWVRWAIPMIATAGILLGVAFSIIIFWGHIAQESFLIGSFFSILLLFLFSFIFYILYTKWLEIPKSSVRRRKKMLDQVKIL